MVEIGYNIIAFVKKMLQYIRDISYYCTVPDITRCITTVPQHYYGM